MTARMERVRDVKAWLAETGRKVSGQHAMTGVLKRVPWPYCKRCGLVALRNDATRKALSLPCVTWEDA